MTEEKQRILSGVYIINEGESRNDSLLNWKDKYTVPNSKNYDYHQETVNMMNGNNNNNSSKSSFLSSFSSLLPRNKKYANCFEWNKQSMRSFIDKTSNKECKPNTKTCHTTTDIGNSLILLGGMSKKMKHIEVLEMSKTLNRIHQLTEIKGLHPCCRWAHTASYIAPLNAIIMTGGFDSTYNWNDIRLLFLSSNNEYGAWYQLQSDEQMRCRALHSSTVRYIKIMDKEKILKRNICEIYIFGGQFCNGGPYEYNNELFKIQFYDEITFINNGDTNNLLMVGNDEFYTEQSKPFILTDIVSTWSNNDLPPPRSQHFAWIDHTNNRYWIYGGLNANTEFNDLWYLDLITKQWMKVEYSINNILNAPSVRSLNSHNFRLNLYGDKFYYSQKQNKLLIMHCVDMEDVSTRNARIVAAIKTHKDILMMMGKKRKNKEDNDENDDDDDENDVDMISNDEKENMILIKQQCRMNEKLQKLKNNIYWFYILDLDNKIWDILVDDDKDRPQSEIVGSKIHRVGNIIWLIGGKDHQSLLRINRLNNIIGINIPSISISWKQERLIWIGNLKNDNNNKCVLKCLPKEIVGVILSFFKQNAW